MATESFNTNALCCTHRAQNHRQSCESTLWEEHHSTEKKPLSMFKSKISHNRLAKIFTETEESSHVPVKTVTKLSMKLCSPKKSGQVNISCASERSDKHPLSTRGWSVNGLGNSLETQFTNLSKKRSSSSGSAHRLPCPFMACHSQGHCPQQTEHKHKQTVTCHLRAVQSASVPFKVLL